MKVSTFGLAAVTDSTRSVVTPAESFGVIVIVALSPAARDPEVELRVNDAGAPATVQTTVVEADNAPGALVSSVFWALSVQTLYVIVASPAVTDSPNTGKTTFEVPVSVFPLRISPVCKDVTPSGAPATAVRAISLALIRTAIAFAPVVLPTEPVAVIFKIPPTPARATQVPLIAGSCCAFDAGTATKDISPVTSATTAICEIRLSRDVFVDIDFLSLVKPEDFSSLAR